MGLWWEVYTYSVDSTLSSLLLVDVPSGDLEVVVISILGILQYQHCCLLLEIEVPSLNSIE